MEKQRVIEVIGAFLQRKKEPGIEKIIKEAVKISGEKNCPVVRKPRTKRPS